MAGERFKQTQNSKKKQLIETDTVFFEADTQKIESEDYEQNDAVLGVYEGPIQKKTENNNGRVYQQEFWDHFFNSDAMMHRLENKLMLGRLTHPDEGVDFDLNYTSHAVTDVWDGKALDSTQRKEAIESFNLENSDIAIEELIFGRTEVFATEAGQDLHAMLEAGVNLGVSSRSAVYSSVENGTEYIEEGDVFGWDYVAEPSVEEAVPEKVESGTQISLPSESGCKLDFGNEQKVTEQIKGHESNNENAKVIAEATNIETSDESDTTDKTESKSSDGDNQEDSTMGDENELNLEALESEFPKAKQEIDELTEELVEMEDTIETLEGELDKRTERAEKAFNRLRSVIERKDEQLEQADETLESSLKEAKEHYQALDQKRKDQLKEAKEHYQNLKQQRESELKEAKKHYQALKGDVESEVDFYESFIHEMREQFQETKTEYESKLEELETKHAGSVLEMYAEVCLERLGERDNDKVRNALLTAESLEEMDTIKDRLQSEKEAKESGLPTNFDDVENDEKRTVMQEAVESDSEESDTYRRVKNIGSKL